MTRTGLSLLVALFALSLGACSNLPNGSAPNAARPQADLTPGNTAEAGAKVHVELGKAYLQIARYEVALDEAKAALAQVSNYPAAYHLLGLVYMNLGEPRSARENFLRALQGAPDDPEFNNSYGWFLCTQQERAEGLERLARAARNPYYRTPTLPYTNAGMCHLLDKDDAGAEPLFLRAVEADPSNGQALLELANIAYRRSDFEAASTYLIQLHQRRDPTAESAWLGVRTERRLGHQDAEASYAAQLRNRFAGSPEYQAMMQGRFE